MPALRLSLVSAADAERVVAEIWPILEQLHIASPRLSVPTEHSSFQLSLDFKSTADAALVWHALQKTLQKSLDQPPVLEPAARPYYPAERYRLRAEEYRTAADSMRHRESRDILRRLAADYELLADSIENRQKRLADRKESTG